ncbi:MAG: hypothetical protein V5A68_04430 [Candidatus Thermoplasmatota archaeon]
MPRCRRLRNFIREYTCSSTMEKISFIPPFIILIFELILLEHAISISESHVIFLTTALLTVSIIEILIVSREMHEHIQKTSFDRNLTIRLDDFILQNKMQNVKKIVESFIDENPKYCGSRNKIYHIACQIMKTHTEELWEGTLKERLKLFINDNPHDNLQDILNKFTDKYPEYQKNPGKIYPIAAQYLKKIHGQNKKEK